MNNEKERKLRQYSALIKGVLFILGSLILIQAVRAVINWTAWRILQPHSDSPLWDGIPMLSMILTALVFILIAKPSRGELGLGWQTIGRVERIVLALAGSLLLALLASSFWLDRSLFLSNLHGVLLTPVLEELLFRGWVWSRLEHLTPERGRGLVCYILTTGLFAIWHLGYADVIAFRGMQAAPGATPFSFIMIMKVLVGGAVGLMAGFARWRSGKVYWPVVLHGLWNMFGR